MATGTRYIVPYATALDAEGVSLAGAKLYFYMSGTATPLDTFSDVGLSIPNTNPVIADAGGLFPNIFMLPQSYKVVLTDAMNNQLWTADPVTLAQAPITNIGTIVDLKNLTVGPALVGSLLYVRGYYVDNDGGQGFFLVTNLNPGPDNGGTIFWSSTPGFYYVRQYSGYVNARWFGAGSGHRDDWAALDACWNYAINTSQNGVFCPVGVYLLSKSLNINNASLIGAGEVGTLFQPTEPFVGDAVLYLNTLRAGGGGTDARYTNFRINGRRDIISTTVAGLRLVGNVLYNTFENIRIEETTGPGVSLDATLGPILRPQPVTFISVHVSSSNTHGWQISAGRNIDMIDCASESCDGDGFHLDGETDPLSKIGLYRPYIEGVKGNGIFLGNGDEFQVFSPLVGGYGSADKAYYGYIAGGTVVTNLTYLYGGQFIKNTPAHPNSRNYALASGYPHTLENTGVTAAELWIPDTNRNVTIRGTYPEGPVSSIPLFFTNGDGPLATNTITFLGANSGAQSLVESDVRMNFVGYGILHGMYAEATTLPGVPFQYQVQIFIDTNPLPDFLCVLTDANNGVDANYSNRFQVSQGNRITCRVRTDMTAPIPLNGLHVTVGLRL